MKSYDINYFGNKVKIVYRNNQMVKRMLTIKIGDTLKVEPDNPLKKKHRGRICTVTKFIKDDIGSPIQAQVTFNDTKKSGRVDLQDLVAN